MNASINFELIINLSPGYIYWKDLNSVYIGCNHNLAKISGLSSPKDIIGKTDYDFQWGAKEAAQFIEDDQYVIKTRNIHISEYTLPIKNANGTNLVIRTEKSPLLDYDNNVVGILAVATDITSVKEAELLRLESETHKIEKEQQEKFKKIVEQVVHDIRSPIATMQMVLSHCEINPEHSRITLNQSALRIQDIANQLLVRFKPNNVKNESIVEPLTIRTSILVSADILEIIAEKKYEYSKLPIDFIPKITQAGNFAFIDIDAISFRRMLSNLINNSVDALKGKVGVITVHLDVSAKQVSIVIEDDGCGMPMAVKEKILNNIAVTSGKEEGHGIGFEQIRDTLNTNGGQLAIESKQDVGTKVILSFPKAEAPDWICNQIDLRSDDVIIILDDDPSIHGAWDTRIEKSVPGVKYKHFEKGADAIKYINNLTDTQKSHIFMLTDYELLKQGMDGLDVVNKTGITRSVLVTSHHNNAEVRSKAKASKTKVLPKPLAAAVPIIIVSNTSVKSKKLKTVDLVFIDDDKTLVGTFMRYIFKDKLVDVYHTAKEFLDCMSIYAKDTKFLIDNQFKGEDITGIEIAGKLHKLGFNNLYLFSGLEFNGNSVPDYIQIIEKTDMASVKQLVDIIIE